MKKRPDLLAPEVADKLELIQLTEGDSPSSHIYMEAQVFTPDSSRFILHEAATAHGTDHRNPQHRYLVCDLENSSLYPVTCEIGAWAPAVAPDGKIIYYFVDETEINGGRLTLKKVNLDGTERETIMVLDSPLPGTSYRPSCIYPLSTIRSDGRKIAVPAFLGDGIAANQPWGLMVFDLEHPAVELILSGPSWCNIHPQYSRSRLPGHCRDIMIQENHGNTCDRLGKITRLTGGNGADIHVIRDDGTHLRDFPWGRDGNEFCQGHQCWRGTSQWAITSTVTKSPAEHQLIEGRPIDHVGHIGPAAAAADTRNNLSRDFPQPHFFHFGTDIAGTRLVTDSGVNDHGGRIYLARFNRPGLDPLTDWLCLAHPRCTWGRTSHLHPFLSPDGSMAFFNSDESGTLQAYMIKGLKNLF